MTPAFLQNELVRAFCWTLIHSLWQGLILAAVTGLVLVLTRRSHAKKRYGLLSMLFFLFLVVATATFVREINLVKPAGALPVSSGQVLQQVLASDLAVRTQVAGLSVAKDGFVQRFVDYFNANSAMVVMIWFIIFFAKLIRLGGDLFYIQRLRSYKTNSPAGEWKKKIKLLAEKIGLPKQVQLLESAIIKVPVTMGVFKPMILLPVGLLAYLPADEIEAILLHELAHIKRRDYFVNLLQSLAETIFFFNPALLWLSSMIRDERENCCDDIAIAVTNNKTNFINALISFQEYHYAKPNYGMAFPGKKQQLLNRVKRIVSNNNKTLNAAEKSMLGFGVALLLLFSLVTAQQTQVNPDKTIRTIKAEQKPYTVKSDVIRGFKTLRDESPIKSATFHADTLHPEVLAKVSADVAPLAPPAPESGTDMIQRKMSFAKDTLVNHFSSFSTTSSDDGTTRTLMMDVVTKDGKRYTLKKVNDVLEAFSVDGKQIPPAEFGNYKKEIDSLEEAYRAGTERSKKRKEIAREQREDEHARRKEDLALRVQTMKEQRMEQDTKKQIQLEKRQYDAQERARERKEGTLKYADSTRERKPGRSLELEQKKEKLERISIDHKIEMKKNIDLQEKRQLDIKKQKITHEQLDSLKKISISKGRAYDARKEEWLRTRKAEDDSRMKASAAVMRNIIDDLENENVKVDTRKSWFALDNNKFIVDGKDMSKELHDKFKTKYLNKSDWGYYYGHVQVSGHGIFLDNKDVPAR